MTALTVLGIVAGIIALIIGISVWCNGFPHLGRLARLRRIYDELESPRWRIAARKDRFVVTDGTPDNMYFIDGAGIWWEVDALLLALKMNRAERRGSAPREYPTEHELRNQIATERLDLEKAARELDSAMNQFDRELTS